MKKPMKSLPLVTMLLGCTLLTACTTTYVPPVETPPPPVATPAPEAAPQPAPVVVNPAPQLPPPVSAPAPEPVAPAATPTSTLLASVQAAVAAGDLDRGAALSERALRISPRDAHLWYQLALIRYRQQRFAEAGDTARRALSMAGSDAALQRQINELLQQLAAPAGRNN
jgi:hypothetical protein